MSGVGIKRKRLGEQAWREVLRQFESSGVSVTAFCKREGVVVSSFHRWRERLTVPKVEVLSEPTVSEPKEATAPKFIELGTLGQSSAVAGRLEIKLDLGGGLSLHLVRG